MENKLEQLLNSLIEKGWQPFREKAKSVEYLYEGNTFYFKNIPGEVSGAFYRTIRELVSKESQLWQFVCENGMIRKTEQNSGYVWNFVDTWTTNNAQLSLYGSNYRYRLIESALCDEDKLEEFLLENIKL